MVQARFQEAHRVFVRAHLGFVTPRQLGPHAAERSRARLLIMIIMDFDRRAVLPGRHDLRTAAYPADRRYGGLAACGPLFAGVLTIVSLSSIALPGINGFVVRIPGAAGILPHLPIATAPRRPA